MIQFVKTVFPFKKQSLMEEEAAATQSPAIDWRRAINRDDSAKGRNAIFLNLTAKLQVFGGWDKFGWEELPGEGRELLFGCRGAALTLHVGCD